MTIKEIPIGDRARLTGYLHSANEEMKSSAATKRPAMIICPGGGYSICSDREADPPACSFLQMGMQVFILWYSLGEDAGDKNPMAELATAVKIVRENCMDWQIDPEKIAVCGFSAGAHLAASLGVHWNDPEIAKRCGVGNSKQLRPDAMVLCYPVITAGEYAHVGSITAVSSNCTESLDYWSLEKQVSDQTPPTFLWHTMEDQLVPVENSFYFAMELHKHGVPCECHLFEKGQHGLSTATTEVDTPSKAVSEWLSLCKIWLEERFGNLPGTVG